VANGERVATKAPFRFSICMEMHKIKNLLRDHPDAPVIPLTRLLSSRESDHWLERIAAAIGVTKDMDAIATYFDTFGATLEISAEAENFSLCEVLRSLNLAAQVSLFVLWYRQKLVERYDEDFLDKYFDYVWYPSVDDIEIFNTELSFVISVRHDGTVLFKSLHNRPFGAPEKRPA
jgi:hypothetical protein